MLPEGKPVRPKFNPCADPSWVSFGSSIALRIPSPIQSLDQASPDVTVLQSLLSSEMFSGPDHHLVVPVGNSNSTKKAGLTTPSARFELVVESRLRAIMPRLL